MGKLKVPVHVTVQQRSLLDASQHTSKLAHQTLDEKRRFSMNLEHRVREGSTKFRVHIHHVVPETDKGTFVSNLCHEVCDHEVSRDVER